MKNKIDYRYYIAIAITVGFLAFGILFPNALPRLLESVQNVATTLVIVFCKICLPEIESPVMATVLEMPTLQFSEPRFEPLFSMTWGDFSSSVGKYFSLFFNKDVLLSYLSVVGHVLLLILRVAAPVILIVLLFKKISPRTYETSNEPDEPDEQGGRRDEDSAPWKAFKKAYFCVVLRVVDWIKEFVYFLRNTPFFKVWLLIWAIHFNMFAILVDGLCYLFYLATCLEVASLWGQVQKLVYDVSPMLRFVPVWVWVIIGAYFFSQWCRDIAYAELYHRERCNRGFINERGVVSVVYGNMGVGKTALITDMALSAEVELRDRAFEIILECDMMFPFFPWATFREELKERIARRYIVDLPSCRRWVSLLERQYAALQIAKLDKAMAKGLRRHADKINYKNFVFDYEERFGMTYDDKLTVSSIWQTLENYACAYFVYTIQSSLIVSNYSIRVDSYMMDMGNFPVWNSDFFKRDSRLIDSLSRHSKILDYDMLRLGTRMVKDNPLRNAFGFGVWVISEIDKERKNGMEIMSMKVKTEECNQRTDLFDACLKMSRHACVIANRVFVKILCDLQRPEDWGASGREVGEVIFIESEGELSATLPVFSLFWIFEWVYVRLKAKFDAFYVEYIVYCSENTLRMALLKWFFSILKKYFDGVNNTFGCQTLHLEVESGRMDKKAKKKKYYRMPKKIYSGRYKTNCLSAIFQNGEVNTVSIEDFIEYADDMASDYELSLQHSHFYKERYVKAA